MDLVTHHRSRLDRRCLELLDARPDADDFIVGEEVSCRLPGRRHRGAPRRLRDDRSAAPRPAAASRQCVRGRSARLREAGVFFALNHLLHFYRGRCRSMRYLRLLDEVPALEVQERHDAAGAQRADASGSRARVAPGPTATGPHGVVARQRCAHAAARRHDLDRGARARRATSFSTSLRRGLGRPGGRHGGAAPVAGDAYGVVARYMASLAGLGPRDHRGWRRAACLAFARVSLPFQFLPLARCAVGGKIARTRARCVAVGRRIARRSGIGRAPIGDHRSCSGGVRSHELTAERAPSPASASSARSAPRARRRWRAMLDGECGIASGHGVRYGRLSAAGSPPRSP